MTSVWVIGQITIDKIFRGGDDPGTFQTAESESGVRIGGKAFNIAAAIAKLGVQVSLISAVGDDFYGKFAFKAMQSAGIGTDFIVRAGGRTRTISTPITKLTEGIWGERAVSIEMDTRIEPLYKASLEHALRDLDDKSNLPSAAIYTLELSTSSVTPMANLIRRVRSIGGSLVVGNPAPRQMGLPSPAVWEILRQSQVLIPNKYESRYLLGEMEYSADSIGIARRIREIYGIGCCVCTLGSQGWAWSDEKGSESESHISAAKVREKVGASDVFTGVYTVCALAGPSTDVSCLAAGVAAREAIEKSGGYERFPSREELIAALRRTSHESANAALDVLRQGQQ